MRDEETMDDAGLPEGLRGELRGMYGVPGEFPAGRDAGVLVAARRVRGRRRARWWMVSGAVAAGLIVVAGMAIFMRAGNVGKPVVYVRTGDIRDAFYVARELKGHRAVPASFDENHDGVVDERDVKLLAMAAVRVDGGAGGAR